MEKSKQIEEISNIIKDSLKNYMILPKMYHSTKDIVNIPLIIDGKEIIIEIKTI
jgi:hypothetical protein